MAQPSDKADAATEACAYLRTIGDRHDAIDNMLLSALSSLQSLRELAEAVDGTEAAVTATEPIACVLRFVAYKCGRDISALAAECKEISANLRAMLGIDDMQLDVTAVFNSMKGGTE